MKRVIIITYYWPPAGGSGVQRWLKYSKYLPENGWKPIIYTPENPEFPARDESMAAEIHPDTEVLKRPILEPYQWYKWLTGRKESVNVGFIRSASDGPESRLEKLSRWVRGNFFIPDARFLWIRPSVRFLQKYVAEHGADAIISTGPPHSMHLIAKKLSAATSLPWLADFRDPWTGIDFYDDLLLSRWADRRHQKLERVVLETADAVTTVSGRIGQELKKKGAAGGKLYLIANGYDEADLPELPSPNTDHATFTLLHSGSLVPSRNPEGLWKALADCCREQAAFAEKLRIRLIGSVDGRVHQSLERNGLLGKTEILPYMPHREALKEVFQADVLLLLINRTPNAEGFLSGKVFEYLLSQRPIFCVGPAEGDAAEMLQETGGGVSHHYDDVQAMKSRLFDWFRRHEQGQSIIDSSEAAIQQYSRRAQAAKIAGLLNQLHNTPS